MKPKKECWEKKDGIQENPALLKKNLQAKNTLMNLPELKNRRKIKT